MNCYAHIPILPHDWKLGMRLDKCESRKADRHFSFLCRTKRAWRPNIQKKRFYSYILGTKLQLRVTCAAMRCIDKAGGFDSYIYHTPDKKLGSKLGSALKQRMFAIVKKYPDIQPPPLVKRYPRPPRNLQTGTVSDETTTGSTNTRTRELDQNFTQDIQNDAPKDCG